VYGTLLFRLDQAQTALAWFEQAVTTAERLGDTFVAADARLRHASALRALHRETEADAELEAVDRAVERDPQTMRYEAALSAIVRAQLLASRGNLSDARTRLEPVLTWIHDPNYGVAKLSHEALLTASQLATAQGRLAEAEAHAREALRINEARARDLTQSADVGEAALVLAQIRLQLNDRSEAQALASRAAIALENGLGANHSLTQAAVALARR
jgi:tetratricopeptide (TPR) repeat protein